MKALSLRTSWTRAHTFFRPPGPDRIPARGGRRRRTARGSEPWGDPPGENSSVPRGFGARSAHGGCDRPWNGGGWARRTWRRACSASAARRSAISARARARSARLLGSALDAGLNVIDTAECYEDSEELIGKALGARRREVYLFTQVRARARLERAVGLAAEALLTQHRAQPAAARHRPSRPHPAPLLLASTCSSAATPSRRWSARGSAAGCATSATAATARRRARRWSAAASTRSRPR